MTMDLIGGIVIVVLLTAAMATSTWHYHRGLNRIRHQSEALRRAEQALAQLQTTGDCRIDDADSRLTLEPDATAAPEGWRWVRLRLEYRDARAILTALVRQPPATGGAP